MRYHYTPIRRAKIKMTFHIQCWWGSGATGTAHRSINGTTDLKNSLVVSLRVKYTLTYHMILPLGIYPKEI